MSRRVGAIRNTKGDVVYLFGYGTYEGDEVPPPGVRGPFGDASKGCPNPKITLDSGEVVWGCQCWWASEKSIRELVAKFSRVEICPIPDKLK